MMAQQLHAVQIIQQNWKFQCWNLKNWVKESHIQCRCCCFSSQLTQFVCFFFGRNAFFPPPLCWMHLFLDIFLWAAIPVSYDMCSYVSIFAKMNKDLGSKFDGGKTLSPFLSLSLSLLNCEISDVLAMDIYCLQHKTAQESEEIRFSLFLVFSFRIILPFFACLHSHWTISSVFLFIAVDWCQATHTHTQPLPLLLLLFASSAVHFLTHRPNILYSIRDWIIFMRGNYEHVQDIFLLAWVCVLERTCAYSYITKIFRSFWRRSFCCSFFAPNVDLFLLIFYMSVCLCVCVFASCIRNPRNSQLMWQKWP